MPNPVLTRAIDQVASGRDLSAEEAASVLAEIMHGDGTPEQIAAFLIALRTKGETVDEVAGLARTMRELATPVPCRHAGLLDTAGTGGGLRTFNVSTTAALIAAGAGCAVAKHGNRSATGLSGSADLLEALGARLDLEPEAIARCIDEVGFGFMFAPAHHQATRYVIGVRRELGVRTIFNLLGPLTNPAGASRQLVGVADAAFLETVAGALAVLGVERALVVCGAGGMDEISTLDETSVVELRGGELRRYQLTPEELGVRTAAASEVAGGAPGENAALARAILAGEPGPRADLALVNAGGAIYAAGAAESVAEGVDLARRAVASGAAADALERYVALSRELAGAGEAVR